MSPCSRRTALGLALLALAAACRTSQKGARCETCGMHVNAQDPFFAELEPEQGARVVFDSPRCAFSALPRHPGATLFVREYYEQARRPGSELRFVEQSDVVGPMGPDLIPVDPAKVTAFVTAHGGGRISSFDEAAARFATAR